MNVASLPFLLLVLGASAFFFFLRAPLRRVLLAALNAAFLASLIPNAATAVALAVFLLSGWVVARAVAARARRFVVPIYLLALVAVFLVLKKYTFLGALLPPPALAHPIAIVGLSYMLFRQIHFVVDAAQGQIEKPSLWVYLNYQLNLFTVLSGPIQRYQDFAAYWRDPVPLHADATRLLEAYARLLWGLVLMVVIAGACFDLYRVAVASPGWHPAARAAAIFYGYPAYVFLNFAGYCSIVIAAASLFGMRVPENFNQPYRARNMIDYWNRWHITLSHWIRDYVFTPSYRALASRWPARAAAFGPVCFFVAFLVAGLWHGSTGNFAMFGLLNGLGVAVAKAWENLLLRRGGRAGLKRYMQSPGIARAANLVTFHYACATILFFPEDLGGLRAMFGMLQS